MEVTLTNTRMKQPYLQKALEKQVEELLEVKARVEKLDLMANTPTTIQRESTNY